MPWIKYKWRIGVEVGCGTTYAKNLSEWIEEVYKGNPECEIEEVEVLRRKPKKKNKREERSP